MLLRTFVSFLLFAALLVRAEEKKEEKKPDPPAALFAKPIGLSRGVTNRFIVRGLNLTNVTTAKLEVPGSHLRVISSEKAEVGKDQDAKIVGDTQITLELFVPRELTSTNFNLVLSSPHGDSKPLPLFLCLTSVSTEAEPNGGFAQAQEISLPVAIQGSIHEAKDVDVFKFRAKRNETVRIRVFANSHRSALDSIIAVYDAEKHLLSENDDSFRADSFLAVAIPADGEYFVTVIDAHDKGGPAHNYLLEVHIGGRPRQFLNSR